jgi:hypothetical protein
LTQKVNFRTVSSIGVCHDDSQRDQGGGAAAFAGGRKMIAKINEELAVFKSREEAWLALRAPEAG